jgi:hypothetical protein
MRRELFSYSSRTLEYQNSSVAFPEMNNECFTFVGMLKVKSLNQDSIQWPSVFPSLNQFSDFSMLVYWMLRKIVPILSVIVIVVVVNVFPKCDTGKVALKTLLSLPEKRLSD